MYNHRTIKINVGQSKSLISYSRILQNIWPYRRWAWGCPFLVQPCICRPQPPPSLKHIFYINHQIPLSLESIKVVHQEDKSVIIDPVKLHWRWKIQLELFGFYETLICVFITDESELIIYMTEYWLEWKYWVNSEMRNIGHITYTSRTEHLPSSSLHQWQDENERNINIHIHLSQTLILFNSRHGNI